MKRLICDITKCLACKSCELACATAHSRSRTLEGALLEESPPVRRVRVLAAVGESAGGVVGGIPLHCRHCEEAECVFACKSGALTKDPQTGAVRCDEERCVGCWMCIMACPVGSLHPSLEGVALKCDLCQDLDEPACVAACPTRAIRWEETAPPERPAVPESSRGLTHVIIGASAAGVGAAEAILEADESAKVQMISEEAEPLYSRPMLYLRLMGQREDLRFRPDGFFKSSGVQPILNRRAEVIDAENRRVRLVDGEWISFDRLLIATGGVPRLPKTPGIEKRGVLGFRTLEDLGTLEDLAETARGAVVLGGGNVGLQAACGLKGRGLEVTVVVRSPHLLSQLADEEVGRMFERRLESHGIGVRTGADVVEILGGEQVEGVRYDRGETQSCEIVVVGKGVDPNLSVLEGTDIAVGFGITVDERMETSVPGIFAAGDVAETVDAIDGKRAVHGIWPLAFEQGRTAGFNMVGVRREYDGAMRMNAAEFFGLELISLGIVRSLEDTEEWVTKRGENVYRKLVFRNGILIGALLVGDIRDAGVLRMLMRKKVDLTSMEESLLEGARLEQLLPLLAEDPSVREDPRLKALM